MRISFLGAAALLLAAALPARAAEPGASKLSPKAAAAVKQARSGSTASAPATSGLKAQKNDDGRLRAPTKEEDAALAAPTGSGPVRVTSVRVNPDGSVIATLGDETMSDLVAVKGADGKVTTGCTPHLDSAKVVDGTVSLPASRTSPETR
jgi:cytoskeletal protein RodZ